MDGTGNDFVIIDTRHHPLPLMADQLVKLASRNHPVTQGCDQIIVLEPSETADIGMRIFNADGSEVASCGNATRCIGALMLAETDKQVATIQTLAGIKTAKTSAYGITVDMGEPKFGWQDIPLREAQDTLHLHLSMGSLNDPVAVSMGNPHAVFFVKDRHAIDLTDLGPKLEHHSLFPQRANIGVAEIIDHAHIGLRVFERGAGETLACGTGACAALVAAHRRGLTGRHAVMHMKGGDLTIEWLENNHVLLSGQVRRQFEGTLTF